jgi:protocatechuate 3,4-dioxygenase beta subunit
MSRVSAWLVGFLLVPSPGGAQPQVVVSVDGPGGVQVFQQQMPPPQAPPRDTSQTAKTGTATLRGRVVAGDTGQPLRKAQVRIVAPDIRENRMTSTDGDGKFEFKEVVPGRYTVSASKGSYVSLQYGQQRPFEPGKPLEILDRQLVEKVDFSLPHGAIITGRVLDEFGEPLPDAMVSVQRYQNMGGQRRLVPAGRNATTNDIGEFRLFAIPPGQYYLSATLRSMNGPLTDSDDRSGYAPTYFPGTTNMAEAQKVTVALGQVISDMNMALLPARMSRVTGTAVDSQGRPMMGMVMPIPRGDSMTFMFGPPAQIKPDGSFVLGGLAPGRYMLQARAMGGQDAEAAYLDLTVNGDDINGVRLAATRPALVTGRVIVDPAAAASLRPSTLTFGLQPVQPDMFMMGMSPGKVNDDFTFEMKASPITARIALFGQMPGWAIRSVRYRGVDVTDSGIEFRPNEDVTEVEVELTNQVTSLSGVVTSGKGDALKDYSVVVFPQDRDKWTPGSRYMKTARPDQDGRYKVSGLPPGEYRVIALDYLDQNEWNTPEFLDGIRNSATPFSINEGETKSLDLRITSAS